MLSEHRFSVYVVRDRKDRLYTGISTHPKARVHAHNNYKNGAKCLRGTRPVTLVWVSTIKFTRSEALRIEAAIKRMNKQEKEDFIVSTTCGGEMGLLGGE